MDDDASPYDARISRRTDFARGCATVRRLSANDDSIPEVPMTPQKPERPIRVHHGEVVDAAVATEWLLTAEAICDGREVAVSGEDSYALAALALRALVTNYFRFDEEASYTPLWVDELVNSIPRFPRVLARVLVATFKDQIALAEREDTPANLSLSLLGWQPHSRPGLHTWRTPTDDVMAALIARDALRDTDAIIASGHISAGLLAAAETTSDAALEAIARRSNPELSKLLCEREELPASVIEVLATDKSADTRYTLAIHHAWDADAAVLASLMRDRAPRVVAAVAQACPEEFAELVGTKQGTRTKPLPAINDAVRKRKSRPNRDRWRAAAADTDLPEVLALACHADHITRARVLRRSDVSDEVRLSIGMGETAAETIAVARSATTAVAIDILRAGESQDGDDSEVKVPQWQVNLFRRLVANRSDLDISELLTLAEMSDVTALWVASRDDLPQAVITTLAQHQEPRVREAIAERPDLSGSTVKALANDPDDIVALTMLLAHPQSVPVGAAKTRVAALEAPTRLAVALLLPTEGPLTRALLTLLAADPDPNVRGSVGIRPDLEAALGEAYPKVKKTLESEADTRVRDLMQHWTEPPPQEQNTPAPNNESGTRPSTHHAHDTEPSEVPIELVDVLDLSLAALHAKLREMSRDKDRTLALVLKHTPEFNPEAQNMIAQTDSWVTIRGRFGEVTAGRHNIDGMAEDRAAVGREAVRVQRLLIPTFPRLVMTARRHLIRALLSGPAEELIAEHYDQLTATERKCLQNHANPRVTAALQDFETTMSTGEVRLSVPSSLSIARVDRMSGHEVIAYVSSQTNWPTHVEHVIQSRILTPTETRSGYALVGLFDEMSELAIAIASNPEALRHMSEESILELLAWHSGRTVQRGWDAFKSARQGDRWAFEEALAKNLPVLPPRVALALEASTNRKVQALLREAASTAVPRADVEKLKRSELSDDEFADLLTSTDVGVIRAAIANDELLLAAAPAQQAALAKRADPKSARAMAAKAGSLSPTAQLALANSGLFVVRRTLAGLDPSTLCPEAQTILREDTDEGVKKSVASWASKSGARSRGTARDARPSSTAKTPTSTVASMDQNALLALIADDQVLQALSPDDQVVIASHRSVDVPRALAKKSPLLSPEAHAALAQSPIFTARRELVRTAGAQLEPSLIDQLANDDDDVVRRIATSIREGQ
jgi:hypothetical protein